MCSPHTHTRTHTWQGPPLDLLRQVHEETQHQDCIEACGYRSSTWHVLRALKAIIDAKVVTGESAVTAAPFFESAGRPSKPFGGAQQGNRVILWEILGAGEKEECLKVQQKGANWAIWCKANRRTKESRRSVNTADASSRVSVRSPKVTVNTKKEHHEEGTSQELEAGGNGEMCQHARLILTWSAGYIMTPS
jgi:hypothetical protein